MSNLHPEQFLEIDVIRADFPVLSREVRPGVPLVYLDSTATSQKPRQVLAAMADFYERHNANIHRGIHTLAEEATAAYESARERIAAFIGAADPAEIIFTRNTTESINLVANSWGRFNLKPGDRIVLTEMEHHSNLVPWHIIAGQTGAQIEYISVTETGELDLESYLRLLAQKPSIVAFTHMSNVVGTINPAAEIIRLAHEVGAVTVVDAAQAVPHFKVDVTGLDADFYAFSAHKMCGPTGIGVLYGKRHLLEAMPPFLGGGEMIKRVRLDGFTPNDIPHKFEAGTPAIAEAVGLGAAVDYLAGIGMDRIAAHEHAMTAYAIERLEEVPGVWIFGPDAEKKGGVAAFTLEGVHAHDVSEILDRHGVAVRAGHHCAMPLHEKFGIPATSRASFYLYNTYAEIDTLIEAVYDVKRIFG
ncbi:MAG TPA: cysteine desulfurase [Anaerolineales bacterium]|nr:cysteine desulfurase [Anaerolineales bacterium]